MMFMAEGFSPRWMSVFLQRNFREEEEGVVAAAAEGMEVLQAGNFTGDGISFFLSTG
jgi:hypothetical protein